MAGRDLKLALAWPHLTPLLMSERVRVDGVNGVKRVNSSSQPKRRRLLDPGNEPVKR